MEGQTKKRSLLERDLLEFFLQDTDRFKKTGAVQYRVRFLVHRLHNCPEHLYCGYNPPAGIRKIQTVGDLYDLTAEERSCIAHAGKETWKKVNGYLKSRGLPPLELCSV